MWLNSHDPKWLIFKRPLTLMMVPIEKQRVWNGLVNSIIPVFALTKIAHLLTLTIATALPEL